VDLKEKVFVIGDLLIDRTFYVDVSKLSPEAPVPVAMLTGNPIDTPGGAGLAAAFAAKNNIPSLFGTYTSLNTAAWLTKKHNIIVAHPWTKQEDLNVVKTRYIDNERHYHLLRVDNDLISTPPFNNEPDIEEEWFQAIEARFKQEDVKILTLLDYRKGLLNEARSQRLMSIALNASVPVYVDSRATDLQKFRGATILKLNSNELKAAYENSSCDSTPSELANYLGVNHLIETQGAKGAEIWDGRYIKHRGSRGHVSHSPNLTEYKGSPDVTGCGDVFDVTFCYEWGIKKVGFHQAIQIAVETATRFAYEPIEGRL